MDLKRLIKTGFWVGCITALACFIYGFGIEPRLLKIRTVDISAKTVLERPVKIAFITDIHIGGLHVSPKRAKMLVAQINALNVDMVLVAGDWVNGHTPRVEHTETFNQDLVKGLGHFADLRAPEGVYSVIGNHDVWYDKAFIKSQLEGHGIRVLDNSAVQVRERLYIVGLADDMTETPDRAAFNTVPDGVTTIALMHSPDSAPLLVPNTALALAGHTHGGQINLPILGRRVTATRLGQPYAYGLKTYNDIPIFISAGIGTSMLPARFRAPPEIVVLTLR